MLRFVLILLPPVLGFRLDVHISLPCTRSDPHGGNIFRFFLNKIQRDLITKACALENVCDSAVVLFAVFL